MDEPLEAARAKHTPGPWTLRSDPYEDGVPYFKITAGDGHYGDGPDGFGMAEIMSEADARLIAAAPELLAALEPFSAFLDALEVMGGNTPKAGPFYTLSTVAGEREITVEDFKAARAAILKATSSGPSGPSGSTP